MQFQTHVFSDSQHRCRWAQQQNERNCTTIIILKQVHLHNLQLNLFFKHPVTQKAKTEQTDHKTKDNKKKNEWIEPRPGSFYSYFRIFQTKVIH